MTCPDCAAAEDEPNWPGLSADCADCDIRAIAMSPGEIRQMYLEQIEGKCGAAAAQEVKRRVVEEVARIRALIGARA